KYILNFLSGKFLLSINQFINKSLVCYIKIILVKDMFLIFFICFLVVAFIIFILAFHITILFWFNVISSLCLYWGSNGTLFLLLIFLSRWASRYINLCSSSLRSYFFTFFLCLSWWSIFLLFLILSNI